MAVFSVSFANLICRFGEHLMLTDLATEVIIPAFTDPDLVRPSGRETEFLLYQTDMHIVETKKDENDIPLIVVYGRFVKSTVLRRTQVMSAEGLIPDELEISSAPSAFFVVILNNHKIIYLPETPHAPSLAAFGTTIRRFVRAKHRTYINVLYENEKGKDKPKSKKELLTAIPAPEIDVLPLASRASIEEFLYRFQTLVRFELRILDTNQELQGIELYRELRRVKGELGARRTTVAHESKDGLDKSEAIEQIHAAAATGNQDIRITGKADGGGTIKGNNEHVQLRVPLGDVSDDPPTRATQLIQIYEDQVQAGILSTDTHVADDSKLRKIWREITRRSR